MAKDIDAAALLDAISVLKELKKFWNAKPGSEEETQAEKELIVAVLKANAK